MIKNYTFTQKLLVLLRTRVWAQDVSLVEEAHQVSLWYPWGLIAEELLLRGDLPYTEALA